MFLGSVIVGVLVLVAPLFLRSGRGAAWRAAWRPWRTILVAWVIMIFVELNNRYGLGPISHRATTAATNTSMDDPAFLPRLAVASGLVLLILWVGVYVVCFLFYINRNMFNAADANRWLPPIAASLLAILLVGYDSIPALQRLIPWLHMGMDVPMRSNGLRTLLAIGGVGTVIALAGVELVRIHRHRAAVVARAEPHRTGRVDAAQGGGLWR
jgi:hypothetical protein